MFSLQKALGKDERLFNLLEARATEARASAQALTKFFQSPGAARSLDEFAQSRRKEKENNAEIIESLATQVMLMFEREEVEALAKALCGKPKDEKARLSNVMLTMLQKMEVNSGKFVDSLGPVSELVWNRHDPGWRIV